MPTRSNRTSTEHLQHLEGCCGVGAFPGYSDVARDAPFSGPNSLTALRPRAVVRYRAARLTGMELSQPDPSTYRYVRAERRPIEILVFEVDPADVDEFLRVDHEVWTLGEAESPGYDGVPFLSKEVWLNDHRPGQITIVIVWPTMSAWDIVGVADFQTFLTETFDARFGRPYALRRAVHDEEQMGIHRWSRFEPAP